MESVPSPTARPLAARRGPTPLLGLVMAAVTAVVAHAGSLRPAGNTPAPAAAPDSMADWKQFQSTVQPFLAKNCYECHGEKDPENNFRLDQFGSAATLAKSRKALVDAYAKLTHEEMPPKEKPRPAKAELAAVLSWFDQHLNIDCTGPSDPGRVTLHRLNRTEYNNTIDDLLLVDLKPADSFPIDMSGYGFDNNGDVLTIAPVLMEKYLSAASMVLDKVVNAEPLNPDETFHWDPALVEGSVPKGIPAPSAAPAQTPAAGRALGAANANGRRAVVLGRVFPVSGEIHDDHEFTKDGTYILRLRGYGTAGTTGRTRPLVSFMLDGKPLGQPFTVKEDFRQAGVYATPPVHLTAGKHRVEIVFMNGPTEAEAAAAAAAALTAPPPVAPPHERIGPEKFD